MKLNKDKNIGQVLFIVEGEKTEFSLLQRIFCNVLGYNLIGKKRNGKSTFISNTNAHSIVAVINTSSSNIDSINDTEYLDAVYEKLINEYDFPVDRSAVFFLFDRDPKSNTDCTGIENLFTILKDPYDNGLYQAGLLLLSYPSIEAFTVSNFHETSCLCFERGAEVKAYADKHNKVIQLNKLTETTLLHATKEFYTHIKENCNNEVDLDNLSILNQDIYADESEYHAYTSTYKLFSMLTAAFLYLGIIELE